MKEMTALLCVTVICVVLDAAHARPARSVSLRARRNVEDEPASQPEYSADNVPTELRSIHLADGILRDVMMAISDRNGDDKLSANEITYFYRTAVQYSDYVAQAYGRDFIIIADMDGDNLLDGEELLMMLVAMDAADWTKR